MDLTSVTKLATVTARTSGVNLCSTFPHNSQVLKNMLLISYIVIFSDVSFTWLLIFRLSLYMVKQYAVTWSSMLEHAAA